MNIRNYNIYFHTHTISGIIISALLYVIFFAGSFAFFKDEISNWQHNSPNNTRAKENFDFNALTDSLNKEHQLYGRDVSYYLDQYSNKINVSISQSKDTTVMEKKKGRRGKFFYIDIMTQDQKEYKEGYDLGEFLYRLHFFAPLNSVGELGFPLGYYLAGAVAIMFLFALITGILVHWEKIISNFYLFRPWEKIKTIWTDIHTALGVISFPYLLVFSITGSYFLASSVLFTPPAVQFEYNGNQDSLYKDLGYGNDDVAFTYSPIDLKADLNAFKNKVRDEWGDEIHITSLEIKNYGDQSMLLEAHGSMPQSKRFISSGNLVMDMKGNIIKNEHPDRNHTYAEITDNLMYVLHFGKYGGYATRVLYFVLGISGCIVIVSGVMIWLTARNKKNIPDRKRKFNRVLANIYLSMSLSMYPVTALSFIVVKFYPEEGMNFIYRVYFYAWLALTALLIIRGNNFKTNRDCLLLGSIMGISIPVANGWITHNWIWVSFKNRYHDVLFIDIFWIFLSLISFICYVLIVRKHKKEQAALEKA